MNQQRIVIVGAGIVGLSAAYALLKQGITQVTVLEQETVDHVRGTSHGLSRLLRFEYGADLLYSEMVRLSLHRWQALEHLAQRTLYTQTGILVLGRENDSYTKASYHILRELGLTTQRLSQHYCQEHFPQFNTQPYDMLTYNAEAGLLHASTCLRALKGLILKLGGKIYEAQRVERILHAQQHQPIRLVCKSGNEITADRVIVAAGPWVHHLLGELQLPVRLTRQYILYFTDLPLSSFQLHVFPAFMAEDLYGFPIYSTCAGSGPSWLKAASHAFGAPVDPDEVAAVDNYIIEQTLQKLIELIPAIRDAKLAQIESCMYDVSPDEDFILDHHPDDPRIIFGTGLTGHGFKFGPLLGELLSSIVLNTQPAVPLERFRLARFAATRSIHTTSVA
ncbi:FAD-dependent oxidoreductase [Ktedonosporobacter rubrisoli]|uniref:FAD-dependent oxidoreductase n=1 Tax=Ktedonosporobacter rubrisoli TaxID=2509675 RepID=A0A4P6K1Q5_KTERU|nr:FAD-dependent oxidoreductase [Ktedonosporobacter rubrisoli]QBD82034.1 FAD-dependent oxidoreductase [Ktedonosporobacter rubrisoli]